MADEEHVARLHPVAHALNGVIHRAGAEHHDLVELMIMRHHLLRAAVPQVEKPEVFQQVSLVDRVSHASASPLSGDILAHFPQDIKKNLRIS